MTAGAGTETDVEDDDVLGVGELCVVSLSSS